MEFFVLGVVVTLVSVKIYQLTATKQQEVKVPVYTVEDDVRIIRNLKELEYWKDFKNGK